MRRLFAHVFVSLDGFIEGPDPELNWFVMDGEVEQHIDDVLDSIDAMIYGRAAYLNMVAYWPSATGRFARKMHEIPKIILSNTLKKVEWNNATLIKDNVEEEIARLKQRPGKDLLVFAGAGVISSLTKMGLIDEYHLLVNPVLLGRGKPLFKENKLALMTLLDTRTFPCGDVLLKYRRGTLKSQ